MAASLNFRLRPYFYFRFGQKRLSAPYFCP